MILRILVFWLLVCSYSSKAEEIDTGNLVPPADEWTLKNKASITQCSYSGQLEDGEVCTGSANQRGSVTGGGDITSDKISLLEQGLTIDEIQQGFDYSYGASIESHISNTNVPTCSATNSDCKDYFTIKLNLFDANGDIFKTHEHTVEMDYVGVQDYSYEQTLNPNFYEDVSFQMNIWSVDAGYTTGYYGGIISDPYLTVQYQTVELIADIIEDVVIDIIYEEVNFEEVNFEVVIEDLYTEDLSFEMDLSPIEEIEIPDIDVMETEIEIEIEAEIEAEITEEVETIEETQSDSEDTEPTDMEAEEETEQETIQPKEIKQKIANKLMANLKDKMSTEAQTTQIALMVVLADTGFDSYTDKQLLDNQFYEDVNLYLNQTMIEDINLDLFYMDYLGMNELVDLQWQR